MEEELLSRLDTGFEGCGQVDKVKLNNKHNRHVIACLLTAALVLHEARFALMRDVEVKVCGQIDSGKSKFLQEVFGVMTTSGKRARDATQIAKAFPVEGAKRLFVRDEPGIDDSAWQSSRIEDYLRPQSASHYVLVVRYNHLRSVVFSKHLAALLVRQEGGLTVVLTHCDELVRDLAAENPHIDLRAEVKREVDEYLEIPKGFLSRVRVAVQQAREGKPGKDSRGKDSDCDFLNLDKRSPEELRKWAERLDAGLSPDTFPGFLLRCALKVSEPAAFERIAEALHLSTCGGVEDRVKRVLGEAGVLQSADLREYFKGLLYENYNIDWIPKAESVLLNSSDNIVYDPVPTKLTESHRSEFSGESSDVF